MLWRLILWPNILSILKNVLCILEKSIYSVVTKYSVLKIIVTSSWLLELFIIFPC